MFALLAIVAGLKVVFLPGRGAVGTAGVLGAFDCTLGVWLVFNWLWNRPEQHPWATKVRTLVWVLIAAAYEAEGVLMIRGGRGSAFFGLGWFLCVLAPVFPVLDSLHRRRTPRKAA